MAVVTPSMLLTMAAPPVVAAPGDPASANLALASAGATVTSSGNESTNANGTDLAIDGDGTTRWSSNAADDAQLTVKLAKPTVIDKVVIRWETACAAKYKLQVSTDGVSFVDATDVISRANCAPETPDTQTIKADLASNKYQYVRMQGIDRTPFNNVKWGISLFEMEVWGVPAALSQNVALASAGGTVTASGQEMAGRWGPALVIDGDSDSSKPSAQQSRWSSNTADNANITVKLAAPTVIDHVSLQWEAACAAKYKLQVSTNGTDFVDATGVIAPTCSTRDTQKLNPDIAGNPYQYVRMQGIDRTPIGGKKYGMSLWEFEVWDGPETTTPTAPAAPIDLIPLPVNMETPDEDPFTLGSGSRIVANTAEAKNSANFLADIFRTSTGLELPVVDGSTGDADDIVLLETPGTIPNLGAQLQAEAYTLSVDALTGAKVTASTSDGVFNGIQTLRQLFPAFIESKQTVIADWSAPAVEISDAPRFDKRGMMLDVARDFKNPDEVKAIIDSLAAYKLSTLHMHLADDQGWRIEITNEGKDADDPIDYGQLTAISGKTAMTKNLGFQDELGHTGYYTQAEYRDIVAYAAERHIEIIPEIDVPGHTSALLHAIPELNTDNTRPLRDENGVVPADGSGDVGKSSMDVDLPLTWTFLEHVFGQIADMTPGEYIHIGGDETHVTSAANFNRFITRTVPMIHALGKKPIGWNEVAVTGLTPGDGIQYWVGGTGATLDAIKNKGAKLMVSRGSTSYLDMKYNDKTPIGLTWAGRGDFPTYYDWDPAAVVQDKGVNLPDSAILGVEAPQWSETIRGGKQTEFMVFPRVVSFAEIGWTPQAQRNVNDFKVRMSSMGQRMLATETNFYDGNQAKWRSSMAGLPVAVSPGKSLSLNVGQFAAPGTKASADGTTIAVDSVNDADGLSNSAITGDLGVSVNWGDGSAATPAVFATDQARNSLSAGSLYQLRGTHSYASAGNFTGTLTATNGTTAQFAVAVAAGTPDPATPPVWDASQVPALSTTDATVKAGYRAETSLSGFAPGQYVVLTLGGNRVGSVLPDAEGKITFQMPVYPTTYSGTHTVLAAQGDRTASDSLKVESNMVPLPNKITQSEISIKSVSSEELPGEAAPNGRAAALLDGNVNSFWHTKYQNGTDPFPHSVVFDLGVNHEVTGFEFTQRQSNANGKIKDYQLFVSDNPEEFGTAVGTGTFADISRPQVVTIDGGKIGRYVKLVALNSIARNAFAGGAEVNIGGLLPGTETPEPAITSTVGTVEAGKDLDLTLEGFPADTDVELSLAPGGASLGTVTTDAEGAASKTVVIPAATVAGNYTVSAAAGGATATLDLAVTAAVQPTTEPTATTDPTAEPTTDPATDPATEPTSPSTTEAAGTDKQTQTSAAPAAGSDDLANTGAGTAPFLLGGLFLLLAGVVTVASRRKRNSTHA